MKKKHLLFWGLVLFASSAEICSSEMITWSQPHFPPYVIKEGPFQSKGIDNQIVQYFVNHLPGYAHQYDTANYQRILKEIEEKKLVAVTPLFRTPEREKYVLYTEIPSYLVLPNGVVIKKADRAKFAPFMSKDGLLDIKALVSSKKMSIGISLGRSYSGILDEMIRNYKDTGVFVERSGKDIFGGMLQMIQANRLDAAFGFPVETQYVAKELGLPEDFFEVLAVSGMEPFTAVYLGLPQTSAGKEVADKVNALLKEKGSISEFAGYYSHWLDSENKERYQKIVKDYYSATFGIMP